MPEDEIQKLHELITNVRLDLRELNTKFDSIKDLHKKVDEVENVSNKAMDSASSAHKRMDKIEKIHGWLLTTFIGGILLAAAGFVAKGGLMK